jgi:hypothetical protein
MSTCIGEGMESTMQLEMTGHIFQISLQFMDEEGK